MRLTPEIQYQVTIINTVQTNLRAPSSALPNPSLKLFMKRSICLLVLLLAGSMARADFTMTGWEGFFKGVEHATGHTVPGGADLRYMVVQALRVDLTDPDVTLFTDPKANNGAETAGYTTSGFLKTYGVQVAINASFFDPCCSAPSGSPMFVIGLSMCTGVVVSAQESITDSSVIMFT